MAKKVGRPTDEPQTHQLQTRVSAEFLQKLDEWRAAQRPIPSRTEAIRMLVHFAIDEGPKLVRVPPTKGGAKK